MDAAGARALKEYVSGGGTVLMTAFSAKEDEHGQWFETSLPGRLSDVFGLKTHAFYRTESDLTFQLDSAPVAAGVRFYEVLEPAGAAVVARFTNTADHAPALTDNRFGKGHAFYLATESQASVMDPVLKYVLKVAGVQSGPQTPDGVYARVVDGRTLYVNTTQQEQRIAVTGRRTGVITQRVYDRTVVLGPQEADLVQ